MKNIRVTGTVAIEDDEYDDGPNGPLTEAAFVSLMDELGFMDNVQFELEN